MSFFPSLQQNFIAYRSSKVSDCIFEIHQLWQSGSCRVYSNSCCSCSFKAEILKIGQSSHKMYSNKILNFQESMTILNACTKTSGNLLNALHKSYTTHTSAIHTSLFTISTCGSLWDQSLHESSGYTSDVSISPMPTLLSSVLHRNWPHELSEISLMTTLGNSCIPFLLQKFTLTITIFPSNQICIVSEENLNLFYT